MKVKLKYPKKIDGKMYKAGIHEFPKAMEFHWYIKALIKSGEAEMVEEDKPLEAKLDKKKAAKKLEEKKPEDKKEEPSEEKSV